MEKQDVLRQLRTMKDSGIDLKSLEDLYVAASYHYSSWKRALQAAAIAQPDGKKRGRRSKWNAESVVDKILELHKAGVAVEKMHREDLNLYNAGRRVFGGWETALEAAGFKDVKLQGRGRRSIWTREKIIESIQELRSEGLDVMKMSKYNVNLHNAGKREFGTWLDAVDVALSQENNS